MKVLMTGNRGRVGTPLYKSLKGDMTPYDLPENDHTDYENLKAKMTGHDAVVHLAWNVKTENYDTGKIDSSNLQGVYNIYQAATETNTKRVIMMSSVHADKFAGRDASLPLLKPFDLPLPDSPYGASKCYAEALGRHYAEEHGLEVICIRLGGVNSLDKPPTSPETERQVWLSHRDLINLVQLCLDARSIPYNYTILYAVSNNKDILHDVGNPFGWYPQDGTAVNNEI